MVFNFCICLRRISIASSFPEASIPLIAWSVSAWSLFTSGAWSNINALFRSRIISTAKSCTRSSRGWIAFWRIALEFETSILTACFCVGLRSFLILRILIPFKPNIFLTSILSFSSGRLIWFLIIGKIRATTYSPTVWLSDIPESSSMRFKRSKA